MNGASPIGNDLTDWWRQAVVYQVYPRSFADSNGDGVGDLAGLANRVPYLSALGVDAVWLSPFYPSGLFDGGYDVDDHRDVDPQLGSVADVDHVVETLHRHGIRLIVDIVPNHTSSSHPWFVEALASPPGSAARDRYVFRDGPRAQPGEETDAQPGDDGARPPSDWPSHFGGSAWTRVEDGQWYLHLFAPQQPDLNWSNPEVRADFERTLRFWADRGVDGFRVDVAHALAKDLTEPLRSCPVIDPLHIPLDGSSPLFDRDEVQEIYATWRAIFETYDPPRLGVAEAVVPAQRRSRYARSLGQAFNFDLLEAPWAPDRFREVIATSLAEAASSGTSSTWVLSNHDTVRHASRYGLPTGTDLAAWLLSGGEKPCEDRAIGLARARAATLLVLALPGSTYLYQGEELGLFEVADLPTTALADPIWVRSGHATKGRDGCRVPLPWAPDGPSFGFGDGGAHLPQPSWFGELSVEAQGGDPGSTLELYRRAIGLRRRLQTAESLTWLESPPQTLLFARPGGWLCLTNVNAQPTPMPAGEVLLASGPVEADCCPPDTSVWLRMPYP